MAKWWDSGFKYAQKREEEKSSEFRPDILDV